MTRLATVAALCLCTTAAHADRVHLVDGAVIEGKAVREGARVVIEIDSGRVAVPADQVTRIEPSTSPVQRVAERRAQLAPRDVAGRIALADYCRDHAMPGCERELLSEVIALAPDHAEARARLGYVRDGDRWTEREQSLRAQGLVQHEGRWLTREQVLEIERLRAEAEAAAHARDKARAEAEAARADLERRKHEAEAESAARAADAPAPQQPPVTAAYPYALAWPAPYAWFHRHDHGCREERCKRDRPRKRRPDDGRPPWPIVGMKDPFDYLR